MSGLDALTALAEQGRALLTLHDEHGVCRYAAGRARSMLGYAPEALLGGGLADFLHAEEDSSVLTRPLERALSGEGGESDCFRVLSREGDAVRLKMRFFPLDDFGSSEYRVAGLVSRCHTPPDVSRSNGGPHDVSEQHRIREELEVAREEAEHASELKSRFLANVSHELRTPLNAIIGMAGLLADTDLDTTQRHYLDAFETAGRNLLELVNNLLYMSKLDAGRLPVEYHLFDLHELLREQFALFSPRTRDKGVAMELDVRAAVPRWVESDSVHLRQILNNLLSNAVKFTEAGAIRVTVDARPAVGDGTLLQLAVADTGGGIPAADRARIFDAFVQADSGVTRRHGGTGLGLAITREFAQLLGGTLWVESTEGEGSTFHVELPVVAGAAPEAHPPGEVVAGGTAEAVDETERVDGRAGRAEFTGRRALVAEDEPTNVLLLRTLLEQMGLTVAAVDDGEKAMAAWREGGFDLILMDMQMPVMDGERAARHLFDAAANGEVPWPPVIALSAHALEAYRRRCLDAGCVAYLTKPVDRRALCRAVDSALGGAA